ncbi:ESX-1 secretion-associated protein EspI-like [Heliangelus exortis]|uniref:ESX-1 secretion-associated protein EspI-like n=1 Tax=Heliangelus exortis TaxID=472823 RepID=UPI003A914A9C
MPLARAGGTARTHTPLLSQAPPRRAPATREPGGFVPQPCPTREPVLSRGSAEVPSRPRGERDARLLPPRGSRLTVALLHASCSPLPARPRRSSPPQSFRIAPSAAGAGGKGTRTLSSAPGSLPLTPQLTAGRAQHRHLHPELPPGTSPHPASHTARHDLVSPQLPLWSRMVPGPPTPAESRAYPEGGGAAVC